MSWTLNLTDTFSRKAIFTPLKK